MRNLFVLTACVFASSVLADSLQAVPILKHGSCPSGYMTSGQYCVPSSRAKMAIDKIASCPSGYVSSGQYCVAGSAKTRLAIPKAGSCPSGYFTSGAYCLKGK